MGILVAMIGQIDMESLVDDADKVDPIGSELMSTLFYENVNLHTIL